MWYVIKCFIPCNDIQWGMACLYQLPRNFREIQEYPFFVWLSHLA